MVDPRRPDGRRAKRGRLSRSAEFDRVFRNGRSHGGRFLVLHMFPRGTAPSPDPKGSEPLSPEPRIGLSVSRKVGGAVERNLVKRLLREAFITEGPRLPAGVDVVVVAREPARELAEREGLEGVRRELAELVGKAAGTAAGE